MTRCVNIDMAKEVCKERALWRGILKSIGVRLILFNPEGNGAKHVVVFVVRILAI